MSLIDLFLIELTLLEIIKVNHSFRKEREGEDLKLYKINQYKCILKPCFLNQTCFRQYLITVFPIVNVHMRPLSENL